MFRLEIETSNDSFQPDPTEQIAAILHNVIKRMRRGHSGGSEVDANGNTVCQFRLSDRLSPTL